MTSLPDWTGVVLAGGRSSRMGRDKSSLDWHGRPLLAHMQALLAAAGATRVVVSGPYPDYHAIPDRHFELGPLGGVASVAAAMRDGVLLLVPVDMPLLSPGLLRELAVAGLAHCVSYRDNMLPMRLTVDARTRAELDRLGMANASRRSLRALHAALGGACLALPSERLAELINCNTPEQWQEVVR